MRLRTTIGNLAGQTLIYGMSTVGGRFLNYLLVVVHTNVFAQAEYGSVSELYAYVGFFVILFTYGLETSFFRYSQKLGKDPRVYGTALRSIIVSSIALSGLIAIGSQPIANLLRYPQHPEYIAYLGAILGLDAIAAIPFAKLRADNRPAWFAIVKLTNIGINIGLNVLFLIILPAVNDAFQRDIGYVFLANLVASAVTLLLLLPQMKGLRGGFSLSLWKPMLRYGWPLVVVGLAGMINELIDRPMLKYLLPGTLQENLAQVGIYSACYKLSILMTLFIQAYRYAAEPFFFAQASKENAPQLYAQVMKYFVIAGVLIFLVVMLFIDVFKFLIGPEFHGGLHIVPILLMANLFLGIYYNISIWYKLTDKTITGAFIALIGAVLTIVLNIMLIPVLGYEGSAWTTLAAYFGICVISLGVGQRHYHIPYRLDRVLFYILIGLGIYFTDRFLISNLHSMLLTTALRLALLGFFIAVAWVVESRAQRPTPTSD